MEPFQDTRKKRPEAAIQKAIITKLELRGWFVMVTHGSLYQSGFPDLYVTHKMYGPKWVEVKNKKAYRFTQAQLECFPKLVSNGSGVWVLCSDADEELAKLMKPCNWHVYLKMGF